MAHRLLNAGTMRRTLALSTVTSPRLRSPLVLLLALALPALGFGLGGCVVHTPRHGHHQHAVSKPCAPSHYWDGHQCRHKGKGKGARKHDH